MKYPKEELEAVQQVFVEIGTAERHFNELQSRYRAMASTWLLAGFAGMGSVATSKDLPLPYQPIVFGIGLAAATGISLIWILDEIVFRNLLGAYFVEGLRFERRYPEMPQVRHNMLRLFAKLPVRRYVGTFYAACIAVPALAGFTIAFGWLRQPGSIPLKAFFPCSAIRGSNSSCEVVLSPPRWRVRPHGKRGYPGRSFRRVTTVARCKAQPWPQADT